MVGVCPCHSCPLVQLPTSPPSDSAFADGSTRSSQILASYSRLRSTAPRGEEREFSSALPRLIILSANRRRDFLSLGVNRPLMMLIMEIQTFFLLVLLTGCKVTAGPETLSLASFLFCIRRLRRVKSSRVCWRRHEACCSVWEDEAVKKNRNQVQDATEIKVIHQTVGLSTLSWFLALTQCTWCLTASFSSGQMWYYKKHYSIVKCLSCGLLIVLKILGQQSTENILFPVWRRPTCSVGRMLWEKIQHWNK